MVFYKKILMVVASAALCAQVVVASDEPLGGENGPATPKIYTTIVAGNFSSAADNVESYVPDRVKPLITNAKGIGLTVLSYPWVQNSIEWAGSKVEHITMTVTTKAQPYVEGAWDRFKAAKERAAAIKFGIPSVHDASEWVLECLKSVVARLEDCKKEKKIEEKKE